MTLLFNDKHPVSTDIASILIVDDEVIIAENLKQQLEKHGYSVPAIAVNGPDAIRLAGECEPDLVLMDILLSRDMDGIDAARIIGEKYDIPVIYLTAHGDRETFGRAKGTGPFAFIVKPYTVDQLLMSVEIGLGRARSQQDRDRAIALLQQRIADATPADGMMPICSQCKRVRDEDGNWEPVENYLLERYDMRFTHSLCPVCIRHYYADILGDDGDAGESGDG